MRLDKYISTLTDLSRKDVKAALKYGRISVDGVPARDPAMQVDERTATVTLDGAALERLAGPLSPRLARFLQAAPTRSPAPPPCPEEG